MPLPPLRQELRIERGAPLVSGAPSWTIFDPVRHMFFQIGQTEMAILSLWRGRSAPALGAELRRQGYAGEAADGALKSMIQFCFANGLTQRPAGDAVQSLTAQRERSRRDWWRWMLDNYLFFRVPLVRPSAFLERTVSRVAPLWSQVALLVFLAAGVLGLLLVSRQWDAFIGSFLYFFSLEGAIAYGFSLILVKLVHELGHAYTATHFGCRVPTMGVSFLVMMPVLYTDTTSAWRLRSRRERLLIDCAGVTAELMLATVAVLAWLALPDGILRSVAFIVGTTSWIMTLVVNLNPFMRFDGYYLLSDMLGVPNLQMRSFALGRWWLRERLFDLSEPRPEVLPNPVHLGLIAYAFATWLYRLVLYVGIALLVYHFFFKALGILLFAVEMVVFIGRPIWHEMQAWHDRASAIRHRGRHRWWLWLTGGTILLLALPIKRHITAPAVMVTIGDTPLVAGDVARIETVHVTSGQRVRAGTALFTLASPDLDRQIARRGVTLTRIEAQLARAMADAQDLSNRAVLERERIAERDALAGLETRRTKLVLRADTDGMIVDLDLGLHRGRWLNGSEILARLVTPGFRDVQAYVAEKDIRLIKIGATGRFIPNDPTQRSYRVRLVERTHGAAERIDREELASVNGGPVAVTEMNGALIPNSANYRVRLAAEITEKVPNFEQIVPGRVVIAADPTSPLLDVLSRITRTYRAEAGG
ncbi:peptidase M50 [Sphingomonas prati]|nr:peptidase M50 [Sphingomonas prati]